MEEAGFDERATVAGVRDLLDAAADLMPALGQATFVGARVGLRPATPDDMPIMGRSHTLPGLFYATGHFRNGILLAPLTGRVLADLVLDNREDCALAATWPQRFGGADMAILSPESGSSVEDAERWVLEGRPLTVRSAGFRGRPLPSRLCRKLRG
jgi:glycine/D-amino acid oxidase-like deaminating enzyme